MPTSRTALSARCEFSLKREQAKSIFSSVNRYRASKKVPVLTWDDNLYTYCVLHNIDMHASAMKSSNFSMGYGYNENVAHIPGSSKKVLNLWNSRRKENENLLCYTTKYSAISVYGDDNDCYATQIFMEHRPKRNDKVPPMKTQTKCDTCKSGKTSTSRRISSAGMRAQSAASTKLRTKSSIPLAKRGARCKQPAIRSLFGKTRSTRNQPLLRNTGRKGQSFGNTIVSGMKSLGKALDILPYSTAEPSGKRTARHTERKAGACRSLPSMYSQNSLPYTFDVGSRPRPHVPRQSTARCGQSSLNRLCRSYERYSFEKCPFCRNERSCETEFCDTCSTYM